MSCCQRYGILVARLMGRSVDEGEIIQALILLPVVAGIVLLLIFGAG
jgi:ABC-type molybdate transport system permease subunit